MIKAAEQFLSALKDATSLINKGWLGMEGAQRTLFSKSSGEVRAILCKAIDTLQNWAEFNRKAERAIWVAFPN